MAKVSVGVASGAAIELHYEDYGDGPPVVLIHGWPLSARSWEAQIPALVEAGHRVIAYDRRGFGESSMPWSGYDYNTLASDLDQLLTQLDLNDVTLVGFSMGGGEVVRYLSTFGTNRVVKAVLACAIPPYLYKTHENLAGGLDDATIASFEAAVTTDRIAFLDEFTTNFFTAAGSNEPLVSEPLRIYNREIASFASPKATLDCIAAFARTDFRADLATLTIPVLVIHGDSDQVVPFEASGKRTHETIPHSTLALIEGGPHGVNATHPHEFNAALIDFLAL